MFNRILAISLTVVFSILAVCAFIAIALVLTSLLMGDYGTL